MWIKPAATTPRTRKRRSEQARASGSAKTAFVALSRQATARRRLAQATRFSSMQTHAQMSAAAEKASEKRHLEYGQRALVASASESQRASARFVRALAARKKPATASAPAVAAASEVRPARAQGSLVAARASA